MRLCLLVVLLGACIINEADLENRPSPAELPLAGLPGFVLAVHAGDDGLSVAFTTQSEYTLPCSVLLPSFVATFDDMPMRIERGAVEDEGLDSPEYACRLPGVYSGASGRRLHIADESSVFDIDVGDARAPRTMELSATTLARGDMFQIAWSSAEDIANVKDIDVQVVIGTRYAKVATSIAGGMIQATMPSSAALPATGNGAVYVTVWSKRACVYGNCSINVNRTVVHQVTIQ